ncbi:membrane bound O-acyl transferase family-domain-containing protein [Aspergillus pseudoustus]|uniref:Membrane bound O-acyl transferase family-domain-containing protein n=1 Tax=Aspergillus pseudoustus TaxID=1810923 RepID=A0ABR4IUH2_9EURO
MEISASKMAPPRLSPPTIQIGLAYALIHLILSTTTAFTPAKSHLRQPAFAAILALAISIQITVQNDSLATRSSIPTPLRGMLAADAWIQVFNGFDMLLHSRISYEEHIRWKERKIRERAIQLRSTEVNDSGGGGVNALWFALTMPNNFRRINTKWQIRPLYSFSGNAAEKGSDEVPSRAAFIAGRVKSVLVTFGLATCLSRVCSYLGCIPGQSALRGTLENHGRLLSFFSSSSSDATWKSLVALIHPTVFAIVDLFLVQRTVYALSSIAAVSLHFSSPSDWPPVQASPREAYSLRRFWGHFWHQAFRAFLCGTADALITAISTSVTPSSEKKLHKRNSLLARYTRYLIVFLVSGLIHLFLDLAVGISFRASGALPFFLVQVVGFGVEDAVAYSARRFQMRTNRQIPVWATRAVGYTWVAAFCIWSWRPWVFPLLLKALEGGDPLTSTWFGYWV